jgi:hypothetical protein
MTNQRAVIREQDPYPHGVAGGVAQRQARRGGLMYHHRGGHRAHREARNQQLINRWTTRALDFCCQFNLFMLFVYGLLCTRSASDG